MPYQDYQHCFLVQLGKPARAKALGSFRKKAHLRLQIANHEARNDLLGGEVGEGHLAGEHLPQHHAQAPHISLLAHTLRV